MVLFTMRITPSPSQRGDALRTLRSLAGITGARRGCRGVQLLRDAENRNEILWIEEWDSEADLTRHIRSDEYRKLLLVMEMSMKRPEIRFHTVKSTAGMEFIAAARQN